MPKQHPTERIVIKEADVDVLMVPLVKWLNRFATVTTLFCCQNHHPPDGKKARPYVMFTCTDPLELMVILQRFGSAARTTVDWHASRPSLVYESRFESQEVLQSVIEWLDLGGRVSPPEPAVRPHEWFHPRRRHGPDEFDTSRSAGDQPVEKSLPA